MPTVSVIMPMYNSEKYVKQAIESLLQQSYTDIEIVAINDGSTDGCGEIVRTIKDNRLVFIDRENRGFLNTLNECIELAKGKYIARLDDDDWCYPERIQKEVEYLEAHPDTVLVGTLNKEQVGDCISEAEITPVKTPEQIRYGLVFGNFAFAHSTFMMRKETLINYNVRYELFKQSPDYHMITQLSQYGQVARIQEPLVVYRIHSAQSTQVRSTRMKKDEIDRARAWFIDTLPIGDDDKRALKRGVLRKLEKSSEIDKFDMALARYRKYCKLDDNRDKKCIRFLYEYCMLTQLCCPTLLVACLKSSNRRWLLSGNGIKFIIKCIIKRNTDYLETIVEI